MISIEATKTTLYVAGTTADEWDMIKRITGRVREEHVGQYSMAMSAQNLNRLYRTFTGVRRPVVKKGQIFIDQMRDRLNDYLRKTETVARILKAENYPVPPNGRFVPYSHQTKIIGCQLENPVGPTMADCFHPDTMIKTTDGYKRIEDMCVGDEIITMTGVASIERKYCRGYEGNLISIKTDKEILVTPSHKLPIVRSYKLLKLSAEDIVRGDYLLTVYMEGTHRFTNGAHDYTLVKIDSVSSIPSYDGKVYNLTSSGHNSYLTDAGFSFNCGTGKTGSSLRAMEMVLQTGEVAPGKIVISCPLSIIVSSWVADLQKFTHLRHAVLWTPKHNKNILSGEEILLMHYPDQPTTTFAIKPKTKTMYRNRENGAVKDKVTTLDKPEKWDKYKVKFKVSIDVSGIETPFGPVVGRLSTKEETRKNFIREQLARTDVDVYIINHDGIRLYEEILAEHKIEWMVVDESTKIKNDTSAVTNAHIRVSALAKRRTILTGTPNPNGFTDLWSQFYFLDRGLTLEPEKYDFLNEYFTPISYNKKDEHVSKRKVRWVIKNEACANRLIETVRRTGIFLDQRDCLDLPERVDLVREVYLSEAQEAAYIQMEELLYANFIDSKGVNFNVDASNKLSQIMKLRQITSGFMIDQDKIAGHFATNPKLDELDAVIEELGGKKIVVACQFTEEIHLLLKHYESIGVTAIYGGVTDPNERARRVREFQTNPKVQMIVLQPQAASHGITLVEAHYFYFFSLDYNFEYYYQVAKRIERIGQKNNMFVLHGLARLSDGTETIDYDLMSIMSFKGRDRTKLFSFGRLESDEELGALLEQNLTKRVMSRRNNI